MHVFRPLLLATTVFLAGNVSATAEKSWKRYAIDASSRGADGVRLADVNGDGRADITTGWEEGGVVRVYLHPGLEQVHGPWPAINVGAAKDVEDAVFVDLDQDGSVDVVSASEGKTRTISIHWAPREKKNYTDPAAWKTEAIPASTGQRWMYSLPYDVDGRHGVDLVVGSKNSGSVSWLEAPENPRDAAGWKLHKIAEAGWIMSLKATDVDRDGQEDIVVSDRSGPNCGVYWLQKGAGPDFRIRHVGAGDVTSKFLDARLRSTGSGAEIAVATNEAGILLFRGGPERWDETRIAGVFNKATALGDLNGDGTSDIAFTSVQGESPAAAQFCVGWIEGDRLAPEQKPVVHRISDDEGSKFDRIELLDLDGDGDLDLLTCEERAERTTGGQKGLGVIWYENPWKSPSRVHSGR